VEATPHQAKPFEHLTPDVVLRAAELCGYAVDGRLLALNSFENRVYQIGLESDDREPHPTDTKIVAKFYRPNRWSAAQIAEEHRFSQQLQAEEIPVVAPLVFADATLHTVDNFRYALYPHQRGRAAEFDQKETRQWMGRFIGRIHAVGKREVFTHRPAISIAAMAEEPRNYLLSSPFIPADIRPAWEAASALAIDGAKRCFDRAGDVAQIRLHGDCHAGNVLWLPEEMAATSGQPAGPYFVDFDDARQGPALQDLWMLLSGDRANMQSQLLDILEGYEDFCEFDTAELPLLEGLRTLRLLHYSAWLAQRWGDPAFPLAFPWFNTTRYWQDRILELREQIALMDEAPLRV
jgi:Ser/Thr protein kinase RdoA (MazF antagonist)